MNIRNLILSLLLLSAAPIWAQTGASDYDEDPYFLLCGEADEAIAKGDYEIAAQRLVDALHVKPDAPTNPLLLSNLGMIYSYLDRDSLALSTLDQALSMAPSLRTAKANRAKVLLKIGHEREAYDAMTAVIETDSLNAEMRYLHGLLALGWGDQDTAEADFIVLDAVDHEGLPTAVAMSTLLSAQSKHREALPYLRRMVELAPCEEYYAALALGLIETEELAEAGEIIDKGLREYPESGELYFYRARLNKARYRLDDARADARRAQALGIEKARIKTL